jgi:hypothetical protein
MEHAQASHREANESSGQPDVTLRRIDRGTAAASPIPYLRSVVARVMRLRRERRFINSLPSDYSLLTSFPKSGRTWFRFILASYFAQRQHLSPVDLHTMFSIVPNFDGDPVRGVPAFRAGEAAKKGVPLIAVTHKGPEALVKVPRHIIFMLRDPRDVMVSGYFHATRHRHRFDGSMDAFVRDPAQGLPALVEHTNAWIDALTGRPHSILSYEDLSAAPEVETARILGELKHVVDRDLVAGAVGAADIKRMRELELKQGIPGHVYDRHDPDALRMRQGVAGGFRAHLSEATIAWIEAYCAEHGCATMQQSIRA